MAVGLYAGIPVTDYTAALAWYERLLGRPPTACEAGDVLERRAKGDLP